MRDLLYYVKAYVTRHSLHNSGLCPTDLLYESYDENGDWMLNISYLQNFHSVSGWGEGHTMLQVKRPIRSLDFSIDLILPTTLWP
jgi:hypothetical protein